MNDKQLKEVERNEAILRKELERIEDKKIVLKKSYDKTINMQLDIQQSLRDSSQSLSPEEVMEQEEIMLIFNRQSRIVEDYFQEEMAKLNKQETDAKDTLEGLVQERQKLYVSQSEKVE
ncbi:TPA: hypothetical protein ACF7BK_000514 [Streptococcus agalactiae]